MTIELTQDQVNELLAHLSSLEAEIYLVRSIIVAAKHQAKNAEFAARYGGGPVSRRVNEVVEHIMLGQPTDLVYDPPSPTLCSSPMSSGPATKDVKECVYCKGTGTTTLLNTVEPCPACGGSPSADEMCEMIKQLDEVTRMQWGSDPGPKTFKELLCLDCGAVPAGEPGPHHKSHCPRHTNFPQEQPRG